MLDKTCSNPAYVCGRLFAVVEKMQKDAQDITSVRDRFFNSANTTPSVVFPTLFNLSIHHMSKLKDKGGYYHKLLREIYNLLGPEGFPSKLTTEEQGRFIIGYYHQMADFYTPKAEKENKDENPNT